MVIKMDKILTFVVNEYNEILLLKGSKNDLQFKKSFWYVVTGGCEKYDLNREETVKREIKEETGIDNIKDIFYLNWIFKYTSLGIKCTEYAYITFVQKEKIILNEKYQINIQEEQKRKEYNPDEIFRNKNSEID